ncbi:MAG: peptidoglycan editing factor PgeF [Candidatus Latescibacteria bacterium]|jgi:polyphenol oxidase|nr:peptidoglycan editing factor PgeF [Candidatus Latescibacterota bacterium]
MAEFNPIVPSIFQQYGLVCGFTTRTGGVSLPPFDSLNLGYKTPDDRQTVDKNHNILFSLLGVDAAKAAVMEQVHGDRVSIVDSGGISLETDGIITSESEVFLTVKVADCIPLLLFDPVRKVIGAVHCGWRPLVYGIAEKAVDVMTVCSGTDPGNVVAAAGPSAGPCCYDVGSDVAGRLAHDSIIYRNGRIYADLRTELLNRLLNSGLKPANIEIIPECTVCNESLYFSHRRDGAQSGRMMGYIMMKV